MSKEKWEVVYVDNGDIDGTGETRTDAIVNFLLENDYGKGWGHKWIDSGSDIHPDIGAWRVRRVKETPTKAEKLIVRMAELEQQLTAMRDEITVELNK